MHYALNERMLQAKSTFNERTILGMDAPTHTQIIEARKLAGHTQSEAASAVHAGLRTWQQWEAGDRGMSLAVWELYLLKAGQHPGKILSDRG